VRGRNPGFSDAQIAAVAKVNDMAVATPNVADFERLGVAVVNPWSAG
jgi:toxin FitB